MRLEGAYFSDVEKTWTLLDLRLSDKFVLHPRAFIVLLISRPALLIVCHFIMSTPSADFSSLLA